MVTEDAVARRLRPHPALLALGMEGDERPRAPSQNSHVTHAEPRRARLQGTLPTVDTMLNWFPTIASFSGAFSVAMGYVVVCACAPRCAHAARKVRRGRD